MRVHVDIKKTHPTVRLGVTVFIRGFPVQSKDICLWETKRFHASIPDNLAYSEYASESGVECEKRYNLKSPATYEPREILKTINIENLVNCFGVECHPYNVEVHVYFAEV